MDINVMLKEFPADKQWDSSDHKEKHKCLLLTAMWLAHSFILNSCNFFIWGCLKNKLYTRNPRMEEEPKADLLLIRIVQISRRTPLMADQNALRQFQECLWPE
jgi:hypothetical protein